MSRQGPVDLELGWIEPSLRADVRRQVLTLLRLFGPLVGPSRGVPDVPDGYGDIDVRGPLQRLLISEWALMLDWPEEFDRRAVSGEQLHLRMEHARRPTRRDTVALFDAGPDQLGGPRAMHVAVWLALHARARLGGGGFRWGVLQAPDDGLTRQVGPQGGERLLRARTVRRPSRDHIVRWEGRLDPHQDDVWVVGGQASHLRHATEVGVGCAERSGVTTFEIAHRSVGGTARTMRASLATAGVRSLLTRGFSAPVDAPPADRSIQLPRIATDPSHDRLYVVRQGRVEAFAPRRTAPGDWHMEPVGSLEVEDEVVAVGSWLGELYALLRCGDRWRLRGAHPADGAEGDLARMGIVPAETTTDGATGHVGVMVTWGAHVHARLTGGQVLRFDANGCAGRLPGYALLLFSDREGLWRVETDALGRVRCVRAGTESAGVALGDGITAVPGVSGAIGVLRAAQDEARPRLGRVFANRRALNRPGREAGEPVGPTWLVVGALGPQEGVTGAAESAWLAVQRVQGELWRVPMAGGPCLIHKAPRGLVAASCAWSLPAAALLDVAGEVTVCGLEEGR